MYTIFSTKFDYLVAISLLKIRINPNSSDVAQPLNKVNKNPNHKLSTKHIAYVHILYG